MLGDITLHGAIAKPDATGALLLGKVTAEEQPVPEPGSESVWAVEPGAQALSPWVLLLVHGLANVVLVLLGLAFVSAALG